METGPAKASGSVFVPSTHWDEMQSRIYHAVEFCRDITAKIANHHYNGEYTAEQLLDMVDSRVRTMRRELEDLITPF